MDKGDIGLPLGRGIGCVKTLSLEDLSCKEWEGQPNQHVGELAMENQSIAS